MASDEIVERWISKYAISQGVFKETGHLHADGYFHYNTGKYHTSAVHPKYNHVTREEAVAVAEVMRIRKLASLRKQIVKLEAVEF